ncbi:hypothetical protein A3Q56_02526 [Intoshia linei]|uniref:Aminotransferase class V domain-containing protein n=1 Tax=Intoshia linei TaxID=1819745 RepID=A0A177B7Z3_9BILA|nr:hypothetical protein A3Q56_02526 [Intoshia linei]
MKHITISQGGVLPHINLTLIPKKAKATGKLVYLNDNHTSVVGMRETVLWRKFGFKCLKYDDFMKEANLIRQNDYTNQLFVFPAQSNFNGKKYNLSIINDIKKPKKFVLLDAASFVPCSKLDLEKYQPDFVVFSFYKIFGYPTGLGALIVHKRAKSLLRKRYFGGGTQDIYLVDKKINYPRKNFSSRFEDGTIPFLQLVGLRAAFMCFTMSKFAGLPEKVENVVFTIFSVFLKKLSELKHDNHQPIILIYGDMDHMSSKCNGAVLNFNVNKSAIKNKIILRTGTFCNIGASQMWLNLTNDDLMKSYEANHVLDDSIGVIDGKPTGSKRNIKILI